MLTGTEIRILAAFFPDGKESTTREIEQRSGYSHERAYTTLIELSRKNILSNRKIGRTLLHSIRKFDDRIYLAFAYHSIGKKWQFMENHPELRKALQEFITETQLAILFGSYVKHEEKEDSDIDILCIAPGTAERTAMELRHAYNVRISPLIIKKEEFSKIKTENPAFWEDLINNDIVLKGHEIFYNLVYRGSSEKAF